MQTDSRWGNLGYPKAPCYLRNCGCGEVSIANVIIEMEKYKNYTPKTIISYCRQYAAPSCDGTYWSGIPSMLKHYGFTNVKECATMPELWKELEKGNRVAVYLMGSRRGGSKGVHWTSSGHFVASVDYKVKSGKHYVYMKDSYSNSSLRNGWISYQENFRGSVIKVWCGKLADEVKTTSYKPSSPYKGKIPAKTIKLGDNGEDVKRLQKFLNWAVGSKLNGKGYFRNATEKYLKIWQKSRGLEADGIFGAKSKAEAKKMVAEYEPKKETLTDKILNTCKVQAEWMKNYVYNWAKWKPRNIEMSKKFGTCVTYVACVLQRLGYLKSGEYLWNNGKGFGTGKVYIWGGKGGKRSVSAKDHMEVIYMGNKTLKSLKSKLKAGDIVMVDDNKSGESGSGGHIFILTGKWTDDGKPYIWDNFSAERVKGGKSGKHTYGSSRKVLAVVRLKEK